MKKAMFITAVTAFSGTVAVIIARLMYFYADYDSPAEVFSFILNDFAGLVEGLAFILLGILAIVNFFKKEKK